MEKMSSEVIEAHEYHQRNVSDLVLYAPEILDNLDMKLSDFNEKNIIDIGAGISLFSTYLAVHWKPRKLTFVDPIYQHQAIQELYHKNKKYFINAPEVIRNKEISEEKKRQWLYAVEQNEKIFNLREKWNSFSNIILNASSGEHIYGVDDNSQDFVVMQYVLNNISNPQMRIALLKEVERVMKYDGYVLFTCPYVEKSTTTTYCKKRNRKDLNILLKNY